MKISYVLLAITMTILLTMAAVQVFQPLEPQEVKRIQEEKAQNEHKSTANIVIQKIEYIKDPRTGICFAYFWGGQNNGGPAFTMVPEEKIPPELLTIAQISLPAAKKTP